MRRLSPTQERVLRWLASGGGYDDLMGYVRPVPVARWLAAGGPQGNERTLESLCRAQLAAWEPQTSPSGVSTYRILRITDAGRAVLARIGT